MKYLEEVEAAQPAAEGRPSLSPAYRAKLAAETPPVSDQTLFDNFSAAVEAFGPRPCLGAHVGGAYEYITYAEAGEQAAAVAGAMAHVGVEAHDCCAVFGANCPEWMVTMQACNRQSLVCVPLYDSLGKHVVDFILDHSESRIVFMSAAKLAVLAAALPKSQRTVRSVVAWGDTSGGPAAAALQEIKAMDFPVYSFEEFLDLGRQHPVAPVPPTPDDLSTIMYTSGTTGAPKGVRLTHRNVASEVAAFKFWLDRVVEECWLTCGTAIGYWRGDPRLLPGDIQACQPTILCSVPRIFERFYQAVTDKLSAAGLIRRTLFNVASRIKLGALRRGYTHETAAPRLDRLVFKSLSKQMLAGRIRLVVSGGAPLASHLEEFMRVCCCCVFLQGYGLSETCAASFVVHPAEPDHFKSVGPPGPAFQLRLESIPDMGYDAMGSPPRGELLLRGPPIFQSYHKDEEETRKAVDAEGWFHTADVGELTPTGSLKLIDRKNNLMKLAQGEFVSVEKVEGVLSQSPLVEQVWCHGSRYESFLVAVVVPAKAKLQAWAQEQGMAGDFAELCATKAARQMVLGELAAAGRAGGLKGFEVPKNVYLEGVEALSVDNGLLTPTFKLRRPQLRVKYGAKMDVLYEEVRGKQGTVAALAGPAAAAR